MLWNKNFTLLIAANFLLFVAVFMLFPLLHDWMVTDKGCTNSQAALVSVIFGVAMFLPGPFNNYLVDAFSRKHVCTRSILLLALLSLLYPYVSGLWMVVVLRILQGGLFAVSLMVTGSTLAIDVTPSNHRDSANRVFTWSGILGLVAGLVVGTHRSGLLTFDQTLYLSSVFCAAAILLVLSVHVCFRAPLDVPLCSFDRFFLFRTLLPGINMMAVPLVLGFLFSSVTDTFFYLCIGAGFIVYLLVREIFRRPMHGRLQILIGQLLTALGLVALMKSEQGIPLYVGGILIGVGCGFSIGQFLRMMILLPLHCERGSGYHTFQLLWILGIVAGFFLGKGALPPVTVGDYAGALCICLGGFIFYQVYIHGYFTRNYKKH